MVYAKSVHGMLVKDNEVYHSKAYPRFHPNTQPTRYEHCLGIESQSMEVAEDRQERAMPPRTRRRS